MSPDLPSSNWRLVELPRNVTAKLPSTRGNVQSIDVPAELRTTLLRKARPPLVAVPRGRGTSARPTLSRLRSGSYVDGSARNRDEGITADVRGALEGGGR